MSKLIATVYSNGRFTKSAIAILTICPITPGILLVGHNLAMNALKK
ncbi:MAG: hypothetical protein AAGA46_00440 [Cyanobacteria bacterium P01_F01_bin.13]